MNKEKMTVKVAEVMEQYHGVIDYLEEIETVEAQHGQAVAELEDELTGHKEAFTMAEDLGQAKMIKAQIKATEEDIELVKSVNRAKVLSMYGTLGDKADAFFSNNTEAVTVFRELDKEMVANTSLSQLEANLETMRGFASAINNSFAGVRGILLETKLVAQADQNKRYMNKHHLGRQNIQSELVTFENRVRTYVRELKSAGLM